MGLVLYVFIYFVCLFVFPLFVQPWRTTNTVRNLAMVFGPGQARRLRSWGEGKQGQGGATRASLSLSRCMLNKNNSNNRDAFGPSLPMPCGDRDIDTVVSGVGKGQCKFGSSSRGSEAQYSASYAAKAYSTILIIIIIIIKCVCEKLATIYDPYPMRMKAQQGASSGSTRWLPFTLEVVRANVDTRVPVIKDLFYSLSSSSIYELDEDVLLRRFFDMTEVRR
eukprot:gene11229-7800_t